MADNIFDILQPGELQAMRIFALRKRQDHDTSFPGSAAFVGALLLAAVVPSPPVSAQGGVPCTAIEADAERLACYDRALRGTPAPPAAAAPAATAAPPAAPAPVAEERSRRERREREAQAPAAPVAAAPPVARSAPAAPAVAAPSAEPAIVPIVIVGVRTLQGRETTFTTDEGVSFVQTDGQRIMNLPDTPFKAELKPGAMGSVFIVPEGRARAIRVRQAR
jgi:hypothetical protein